MTYREMHDQLTASRAELMRQIEAIDGVLERLGPLLEPDGPMADVVQLEKPSRGRPKKKARDKLAAPVAGVIEAHARTDSALQEVEQEQQSDEQPDEGDDAGAERDELDEDLLDDEQHDEGDDASDQQTDKATDHAPSLSRLGPGKAPQNPEDALAKTKKTVEAKLAAWEAKKTHVIGVAAPLSNGAHPRKVKVDPDVAPVAVAAATGFDLAFEKRCDSLAWRVFHYLGLQDAAVGLDETAAGVLSAPSRVSQVCTQLEGAGLLAGADGQLWLTPQGEAAWSEV